MHLAQVHHRWTLTNGRDEKLTRSLPRPQKLRLEPLAKAQALAWRRTFVVGPFRSRHPPFLLKGQLVTDRDTTGLNSSLLDWYLK